MNRNGTSGEIMHEISMSEKALTIILDESRKKKIKKIKRVHLVIGSLTLLNHDQIRFWLKELSKGTIAEGLDVKIKKQDSEIRCRSCEYSGELELRNSAADHFFIPAFMCPECKSSEIDIKKGNEFEVEKIIADK